MNRAMRRRIKYDMPKEPVDSLSVTFNCLQLLALSKGWDLETTFKELRNYYMSLPESKRLLGVYDNYGHRTDA